MLFSDDFMQDENKQIQWQAFLNKNGFDEKIDFSKMVVELKQFLEPVYQSLEVQGSFHQQWSPEEYQWQHI